MIIEATALPHAILDMLSKGIVKLEKSANGIITLTQESTKSAEQTSDYWFKDLIGIIPTATDTQVTNALADTLWEDYERLN